MLSHSCIIHQVTGPEEELRLHHCRIGIPWLSNISLTSASLSINLSLLLFNKHTRYQEITSNRCDDTYSPTQHHTLVCDCGVIDEIN